MPCGDCSRAYFGETYRGLGKRLTEHKADVRNQKDTSSFVAHIDSHAHLPDWKTTEVLWSGRGKTKRKLVESAVIETLPNINSKQGDFMLAPTSALILWSDHAKVTSQP